MSPVQQHTAWFKKNDGEVFFVKVQTYCANGIEEINSAFADNTHFIGVTSSCQPRIENQRIQRKVSRLSLLFLRQQRATQRERGILPCK